MKRILAMVVALCMLMPIMAFGEATQDVWDGKAMVTEVSFVPGTLPEGNESMQAVYTDLLGALSFRTVTQLADESCFQNLEMLISGERILGLDAFLAGETIGIVSELLGDKPVAVTKDELLKLVSDAATAAEDTRAQKEAALAQLALLDEEALNLLSEFFGATPSAYTKGNLAEFISATSAANESEYAAQLQVLAQVEMIINAVFTGDISNLINDMGITANTADAGVAGDAAQAEEMLALLGDMAAIMTPYMEGAAITEGEVKTEGVDDGVKTLSLTLSNEDMRDIMPKFGAALDKSPTMSQAFAAVLASSNEGADMTFEKIFTDALGEIPETMNFKYYYIFDAQDLPVYMQMDICDGEDAVSSLVYARQTEGGLENHHVAIYVSMGGEDIPIASLYVGINSDESNVMIQLAIEGEVLVSLVITSNKTEATPATKYELSLTVYDLSDEANAEDLTVTILDLGLVIETEKGETDNKFTLSFLMDGEALFGLVVKTSLVDAVALPDLKNAVHVTTLSEADMEAFLGAIMQNAMLVVSNALEKLPESVTTVIINMLQTQMTMPTI